MLLLCIFHRWGNWGTERLGNLPKVTQQQLPKWPERLSLILFSFFFVMIYPQPMTQFNATFITCVLFKNLKHFLFELKSEFLLWHFQVLGQFTAPYLSNAVSGSGQMVTPLQSVSFLYTPYKLWPFQSSQPGLLYSSHSDPHVPLNNKVYIPSGCYITSTIACV